MKNNIYEKIYHIIFILYKLYRKIHFAKKVEIFGAVSFMPKIEHFAKMKMNPGILKSTLMALSKFLSIQQSRDPWTL